MHNCKSSSSKRNGASKNCKTKEILESISGKALVFTSYRDSVEIIHQKLIEMGIAAGFLIGKAGKTATRR